MTRHILFAWFIFLFWFVFSFPAHAQSIVFAVEGNSLNALYSSAGQVPVLFGTNVASVAASESGLLNTGYIDLQNSTNAAHAAFYPGFSNFSSNRAFSILLRLKVVSTTGTVSLFGASAGQFIGSVETWVSGGSLNLEVDTEAGATNCTGSAAWSPSSSNYYDLVVTSTGDTTSTGTKVYIDASQLFTCTLASNYPNPRVTVPTQIAIGYGSGSSLTTSRIKVDEFVVWNGVINPSSVTLTTGSGALNGMSRTALVSVTPKGSPFGIPRSRVVNQ